jgi:UDP-glucose 6-dehydrogenase
LKKKISVIGCGWLGLPLATFLINQGCSVKGSTTSQNKLDLLKKHNIEAYIIHLNSSGISGNYSEFLANSETLIINIPPGLRQNPSKNHGAEIKQLVTAIENQNIKNVLYISSTSVFKDEFHFPQIIDSTEPNGSSNAVNQLIKIEQMLLKNTKFNTTILRFGGLIDHVRHPANYLSGKANVANPDAPINLIHKEDCIQIISKIVKDKIWNTVFNVAYPYHPDKKSYYSNFCKINDLPLPVFNTSEKSKGKIIDSTKVVQLLNYTFKHKP